MIVAPSVYVFCVEAIENRQGELAWNSAHDSCPLLHDSQLRKSFEFTSPDLEIVPSQFSDVLRRPGRASSVRSRENPINLIGVARSSPPLDTEAYGCPRLNGIGSLPAIEIRTSLVAMHAADIRMGDWMSSCGARWTGSGKRLRRGLGTKARSMRKSNVSGTGKSPETRSKDATRHLAVAIVSPTSLYRFFTL